MTEKPTPDRPGTGTGTTRRAKGTATRGSTASPEARSPRQGRAGSSPPASASAPDQVRTPARGRGPRDTGAASSTAGGRVVSEARSRASAGLDRSGTAHGHSAVEALLATHAAAAQPAEQARPAVERGAPRAAVPGADAPQAPRATAAPAPPARAGSATSGAAARPEAPAQPPLPPAQDVLLGLASLMGEHAWRWGTQAVAVASGATARAVSFVRGVAPGYASAQVESQLNALAERGQRVRQERSEALGTAVTSAITSAATSDAVREMTVAAIEEATDDVLAVMLPAVLEAVTELETQERLDELMAGLLLRQLPSALEKTLPGVMLRTAARPALGLVPFLGGSAPRGQ